MSTKDCPKCHSVHSKPGIYCSRACANSRGPRTDEFKSKVSTKLSGVNHHTEESLRRIVQARGLTLLKDRPSTTCVVCGELTNSHNRKTCSRACQLHMISENSAANPNCGGARRSKRFKMKNLSGTEFTLDSSYEVLFAEKLNSLGIHWIRPAHIWYVDESGKRRRYHPDFYIESNDTYYDPKNNYLIDDHADKIRMVQEQSGLVIKVMSIEDIKNFAGI